MKSKALMIAVAVCLGATSAANANLLTNGSFEDATNFAPLPPYEDPVHMGEERLDVGSTAMPGWTVVASTIYWIGPQGSLGETASPKPGGGSYYLNLTGVDTPGVSGGVEQTLATKVGSSYELTFDLGSSPEYGLQGQIWATAGSGSGIYTSTNNSRSYDLWETESLSFTATSTSTPISLIGDTFASGPGNGTASRDEERRYVGLDNVNVTCVSGCPSPAVPEPATWAMMLAGFSLIGVGLRRRWMIRSPV